jgi:hypothetical protein
MTLVDAINALREPLSEVDQQQAIHVIYNVCHNSNRDFADYQAEAVEMGAIPLLLK